MRVIAGTKKGFPLETPKGLRTRPTTDRIKETLFNMISFDLRDRRFLDLFAGSGQMGIEALSRGAKSAVFIDSDKSAQQAIRANLNKTGFTEKARVYKRPLPQALAELSSEHFDWIFIDPPYSAGLEKELLKKIKDLGLLAEEGTVIIEAAAETSFDFLGECGFLLIKEKSYKTNRHLFLREA